MEQSKNLSAEAGLSWPEAVVKNNGGKTPRSRFQRRPPRLDAALHQDCLHLTLRGDADVDWLLQWLPHTLKAARGYRTLILDISPCSDLDNLGLSALVVLLRNYGQGFTLLRLCGLPGWASQRIRTTGVESLLGQGWRGEFGQEEVSFQRC
jgi:ABC-type transporter Mla MlaB component